MAKEKSKTLVIVPARLSYAFVWHPSDDDGSYSTALLINKEDTKAVAKVKDAIKAAIEANKSKLANSKGKLPSNLKLPLHDGDAERDTPEYEGMLYLNAKTMQRPPIFDRRREKITDEEEVYSGCYANVAINFYAFNKGGNIGIGAGLMGIQKVRDGERLSGSSVSADDFEDLGDEEPDDFLGTDSQQGDDLDSMLDI